MKALRVALAVVLAAGVGACSMDGSNAGGGAPGSEPSSAAPVNAGDTGTVGAQLTLPAGQKIEVVTWVVSGPSGATTVVQTGSVSVLNTNTASFYVANLPAATGYRIVMSGTAIDGSVTCTGSASFDITARQTTPVSLQLACAVASSGSQVTLVSGESFDCAGLTNVSASPIEAFVGGSISLSATASGPISSALTYAWSAPSGNIGSPSSANTTFTCTSAGMVPVTVTAGDGPVPAGAACNGPLSTRTISVTCTPQTPPMVPALPGAGCGALALALLGLGGVGARGRRRAA